MDVFDTRGAADPSPEQLAGLSEATGEKIRWFKLSAGAEIPRVDLSIIDQLGTHTPQAIQAATRSAAAPGALFRVRMREDFQNARAIVESRICEASANGDPLADAVLEAVQAYEALSAAANGRSHFRFSPNQDAVGSRLQNAIFLSVTSSQMNPACIVRGTVSHGGYLWDYELPGVLGGGESSLGYYLVAADSCHVRVGGESGGTCPLATAKRSSAPPGDFATWHSDPQAAGEWR